MLSFAIAVTLFAAETPRDVPPGPSLDGTWSVLCLEANGVPVPKANDMTVTVRGNILTFGGTDAPHKPMQFEFGPRNTVRAVEIDPGKPGTDTEKKPGPVKDLPLGQRPVTGVVIPKTGVYVVTKDYFCVTLHDMPPAKDAKDAVKDERKDAPALAKPEFKASCVLILKRKDLNVPPKP